MPSSDDDRQKQEEVEKDPKEGGKKDLWKLAAPILFYGHIKCRACRSRSFRNWVAYESGGMTTLQDELCSKCKEANLLIMDVYRQLDGK